MGLLDDAIREHLELKRQHGADPNEVERQEREALGEGRRAEFARASDESDEPVAATDEQEPSPPFDAAAEEPVEPADEVASAATEEHRPFDDEEAADELPAGEPGEPGAPAPRDEAGAPGYDEDPWLAEERDEVPAGESLDRPRPEEPGEDVLEETPEFLQETPEHDRLWFEQRPPRDFDWDK